LWEQKLPGVYQDVKESKDDNMTIGAKGGIIAFALKVSSTVLAFINQIILARFLGAQGVGEVVIAITVVKISSQIAKFGMEEAMMRFVPLYVQKNDNARLKGAIYFSILFCFAISCFFVLLIVLLSRFISLSIFHSHALVNLLPVVAIAIVAGTLRDVIAGVLKGHKDTARALIPESFISPFFRIAIFLILTLYAVSSFTAVVAFVGGEVFAVLLSIRFLLNKLTTIKSGRTLYDNRKVLQVAYTIIFSSLSMLLFTQTDILVLGMLLPTKGGVGIYGYAAKLVFLVYFPMFAFGSSIPPILSSAYSKGDRAELEKVTRTSTRWILSMSMPIVLVLILEGRYILGYVYGSEFESGYPVIIFLTVAHLISAGTGLVGLFLQMTGQHKVYMKLNVAFLIANIILNFVLVSRYGMVGAAVATSLCIAMLEITCAFFIFKRFSILALPEGLGFDLLFIVIASILYVLIRYGEMYWGTHVLLAVSLITYLWKSVSHNDIPWRLFITRYNET
jgi:O-antigen/teichoic acid export membrane protein